MWSSNEVKYKTLNCYCAFNIESLLRNDLIKWFGMSVRPSVCMLTFLLSTSSLSTGSPILKPHEWYQTSFCTISDIFIFYLQNGIKINFFLVPQCGSHVGRSLTCQVFWNVVLWSRRYARLLLLRFRPAGDFGPGWGTRGNPKPVRYAGWLHSWPSCEYQGTLVSCAPNNRKYKPRNIGKKSNQSSSTRRAIPNSLNFTD